MAEFLRRENVLRGTTDRLVDAPAARDIVAAGEEPDLQHLQRGAAQQDFRGHERMGRNKSTSSASLRE